jgi:hypothetical protein
LVLCQNSELKKLNSPKINDPIKTWENELKSKQLKNTLKMLNILGHKGNANQNHTKIPPYSCLNSYNQEHHQQQMLARMQGKRNPHTLLVGRQASATTLENYGGFSKTKNRTTI